MGNVPVYFEDTTKDDEKFNISEETTVIIIITTKFKFTNIYAYASTITDKILKILFIFV